MASKSLGTLTLDIVAKIGGYTAGLDKAEKEAQKRAKAIEKAFDGAATAVGVGFGLMTTAAVGAFAAISRGIDEAAKFQDLAEMTGAAAEGIAGLQVAASTAGVSIEDVAGSMIKLTKNLVGVDDESKAAGAALKNLGINVDEFKRLDPVAQYEKISKALAGFADGAGKTATALALFGKSGAEQLKVMKALEEQRGRSNILTAEQIRLADEYADRNAKLTAEIKLYASALATQFLPAINAVGGALRDVAKDFYEGNKAQTDFALNLAILDWAEKAAVAIGTVAEAAIGVAKTLRAVGGSIESVYADSKLLRFATPTGAVQSIINGESIGDLLKERNAKAAEANQRYVDLWKYNGTAVTDAIKKSFANQKAVIRNMDDPEIRRLLGRSNSLTNPGPGRPLPDPNPTKRGGGGGGAKDDPTKKLLDNELASYKAMADQARELLADRNKMLDLYNQQGLLSVKDYYAALNAATEEATAAQAKAIDDQIAALQKFKAAAKKDTDVADATGKINKFEEEKAKLYRQSGIAAIESSVKQVQAQKAVQEAFNEVNAKVLEFQGNLRAAGEIRFDAQNAGILKTAMAEGNDEIVKQIGLLKQYSLAQADINKAQAGFALAQGDLQIAEERITIARERGTMGEIESLKASGEARKAAVALMEKQLSTLLAINDASRSPEQVQAIERLKVQLESLKVTIDPLADKFNNLLGDAAGNAFGDFITGSKTAKEAFKDFAKTVINEIARMAAKDLAKSLFGGGTSGGGLGGLLSSFLGGGGSGGAAAGGGDALGAFIALNGYADGGFTGSGAANDPAGIVHKGEYVMNASTTQRLGVPFLSSLQAGGSTSSTSNVFNITVPQTTSRATGGQIAAEAQRKMAAGGRNL